MSKIFVLFKKQPWERANAYSVVTQEVYEQIPLQGIKAVKEIGDIEIVKKEDCKKWVEELGGIWYAN